MYVISTEDRETAALICAIAASTPDMRDNYSSVCFHAGVDVAGPAANLAYDAWFKVHRQLGSDVPPGVRDAEAEALIRSGWSPSPGEAL